MKKLLSNYSESHNEVNIEIVFVQMVLNLCIEEWLVDGFQSLSDILGKLDFVKMI